MPSITISKTAECKDYSQGQRNWPLPTPRPCENGLPMLSDRNAATIRRRPKRTTSTLVRVFMSISVMILFVTTCAT